MFQNLFGFLAEQSKEYQEVPRLKINLYHDYEVSAVASATIQLRKKGLPCRVECIMISDSYLMTHLGQSATALETASAQAEFFETLKDLTKEVSKEVRQSFPANISPFVLADMPDGSTADTESAIKNASQMLTAGADAVKLEIFSSDRFEIVNALTNADIPVISHLGYTPQNGQNRPVGNSIDEALDLFAKARMARDAGSVGLVLERVNEFVNQCLCKPSLHGIPSYSIFSGKSDWGGQSLNVWDSIIKPDFKNSFFPNTATKTRNDFPECYTKEALSASMHDLMRQAITLEYPRSPISKLNQTDLRRVICTDPWRDSPQTLRNDLHAA